MESPDENWSGPQIDTSQIADLIEPLVRASRSANVASSLSPALQKHIKKRVAPSALLKYLSFERAIRLAALELETIAVRIRQYRLIEAYPRHFSSDDRDVTAAFMSHLHILRPNELYLIQERGSELLKFCFQIASDLQLPALDQSRKHENAF